MVVGKWEAMNEGLKIVITIDQNGTWLTEAYLPGEVSARILTGGWKIRGNDFIWTYDVDNFNFQAGEEDVNRIVEITEDKLVLEEMNGTVTTYNKFDAHKTPCPL